MRAQSAVEYILLTALILLFIIPLSILSINILGQYRQTSAEAQLNRIGNDLIATAELVQGYGAPSQLVVPAVLPQGVQVMSVTTNVPSSGCTRCTELGFTLPRGELYFQTSVIIRPAGKNPGDCVYPSVCELSQTHRTPGNKRYVLQASAYTPPTGPQVPYVILNIA